MHVLCSFPMYFSYLFREDAYANGAVPFRIVGGSRESMVEMFKQHLCEMVRNCQRLYDISCPGYCDKIKITFSMVALFAPHGPLEEVFPRQKKHSGMKGNDGDDILDGQTENRV